MILITRILLNCDLYYEYYIDCNGLIWHICIHKTMALNYVSYTVEPLYNEVLGTMKITLIVISGFSLYQGKKRHKEI